MNESMCISYIENGDFPMSFVSFQGCNTLLFFLLFFWAAKVGLCQNPLRWFRPFGPYPVRRMVSGCLLASNAEV